MRFGKGKTVQTKKAQVEQFIDVFMGFSCLNKNMDADTEGIVSSLFLLAQPLMKISAWHSFRFQCALFILTVQPILNSKFWKL